MKNKNGFLICTLRGGVNDISNQLGKCADYCVKFDRELIIRDSKSLFANHFFEIFCPKKLPRFNVTRYCRGMLTDSVLAEVEDVKDSKFCNVIRNCSNTPATFDFNFNYPAKFLIHEQFGGGDEGVRFFDYFNLTEKTKTECSKFLETLPLNYIGMHIRHTDIQSDYRVILEQLSITAGNYPIFLCSDSNIVARSALDLLPSEQLYLSPARRSDSLANVHSDQGFQSREQSLMALVDLFGLAGSERFFCARTKKGGISGFSKLVCGMRKRGIRLTTPSSKKPCDENIVLLDHLARRVRSRAHHHAMNILKIGLLTVPKLLSRLRAY